MLLLFSRSHGSHRQNWQGLFHPYRSSLLPFAIKTGTCHKAPVGLSFDECQKSNNTDSYGPFVYTEAYPLKTSLRTSSENSSFMTLPL